MKKNRNRNRESSNDVYKVKIISNPPTKLQMFGAILKNTAPIVISFIALFFSIYQWKENERDKLETQLKAQANQISAWIKEDSEEIDNEVKFEEEQRECYSVVALNNLSNTPVYDVVITVVEIGNSGNHAGKGKDVRDRINNAINKDQPFNDNGVVLSMIPPGQYKAKMAFISHGMCKKFGVEIAFRDYQSNSWLVSADGHLSQIDEDPFEYYNLPKPMEYGTVEKRN